MLGDMIDASLLTVSSTEPLLVMPELSVAVSVIVHKPSFMAVTMPVLSTVAISSSELVQLVESMLTSSARIISGSSRRVSAGAIFSCSLKIISKPSSNP